MKSYALPALAFLLAVASLSGPAHAQWQWRDADGRMVLSDRPPPTEVPLRNILRAPRGVNVPRAPASEAGTPKPAPETAAASTPAPAAKTIAERDIDYRKRQAEAAESAKKAEEAAAEARATREACSALRRNLAALDSGQRIVQIDEKGERSYLDDAGRSTETDKIREQISQRCS